MKKQIKELQISNPPQIEKNLSLFTSHPSLKRRAFTLAEVLIALGIIGVVAALTVPAFVANYREKQTIIALKKVYSELSQVYIMYMEENGGPYKRTLFEEQKSEYAEFVENFSKSMMKFYRSVQVCDKSSEISSGKCAIEGYYKTLLGKNYTYLYGTAAGKGMYSLITPSGVYVGFGYDSIYQLDRIIVDINGQKGPNRYGYDAFIFNINGRKIVPNNTYCNLKSESRRNTPNGGGCTKWVLEHENLDYQKCIKGIKTYCNEQYGTDQSICDPNTNSSCVVVE